MSISRQSPAKLNLFLEVCGKREDGFHELETVMLRTTLCDQLTFELADAGSLELHSAPDTASHPVLAVPTDRSNLILKAAEALLEATGRNLGARITVEKQIPVQAGLGGGSSNAATTLLALNDLWGLKLPLAELHGIAATLGSDINFFVQDCGAAVCRGRGEQVTPISVGGEFVFVAVRPSTGNSTADVFAALPAASQQKSSAAVVAALQQGATERLVAAVFNRLTTAASRLNPQMTDLMEKLQQQTSRRVFMSGSGSTCFIVCATQTDATEMLGRCSHLDVAFAGILRSAV